jgi:hypothetical protein
MRLPSPRRIAAVLLALTAVACVAAAPTFFAYVRDIHPRTVTRFLAQIEQEYDAKPSGDAEDARVMIEYVKDHYRYEDMPDHRDTQAAKELATQRAQTIESIETWITRQSSPADAN